MILTKKSYLQWIVPTAALIIFMMVALGMNLMSYTDQIRTQAYSDAMDDVSMEAEGVSNSLKGMVSGVMTAAYLKESYPECPDEQLANAIVNGCRAYRTVICDEDGVGIDHSGVTVNISGYDYFDAAKNGEGDYLFVPSDGFDDSTEGVLIYRKLFKLEDETKLILLYYRNNDILENENTSSAVGSPIYVITDNDGIVLMTKGSEMSYGDSLWENLQTKMDKPNYDMFKRNVENERRSSYALYNTSTGSERVLFSCPLGISDWHYTVSIDRDYVTAKAERNLYGMRKMLTVATIMVVIFAVVMCVMFIMSRARTTAEGAAAEERAETDLLTGMNNKVSTEQKIKDQFRLHPDIQCAMILFDIDDFKRINDTMGHAFGDEVLAEVGRNVSSLYRVSDIYGRIGGDEFMVLVKDIGDTDSLINQIHRLEDFFHTFKVGTYSKYSPTASVGVSLFPSEGQDFETLYKEADGALYKSKRGGKNQVHFSDESVQEKYAERFGKR